MKTLILIILLLISNFCYSMDYYSAQNGDINSASTWMIGNTPQIPNFSDTSNHIYINHNLTRALTGQFYIKCYVKINTNASLYMTSVIHIDGIKARVDCWGTLEVHNIFYVQNSGVLEIFYGGYVFTDNMVDVTGQGGAGDGEIILHGGGICWDNLWKGTFPPNGVGVYCNTPNQNVGGCCSSIGPLGITLTKFEVKLMNKVEITWTTENEKNNDHFIIEKSKDLKAWSVVDSTIKGSLYSNGILNYKTYDNFPHYGISYYRISQIDTDGTLTIYNDFLRYININDDYRLTNNTLETNQSSNIIIYDISSRIIFNQYTKSVNLETLKHGMYIIKINETKIKLIK